MHKTYSLAEEKWPVLRQLSLNEHRAKRRVLNSWNRVLDGSSIGMCNCRAVTF